MSAAQHQIGNCGFSATASTLGNSPYVVCVANFNPMWRSWYEVAPGKPQYTTHLVQGRTSSSHLHGYGCMLGAILPSPLAGTARLLHGVAGLEEKGPEVLTKKGK